MFEMINITTKKKLYKRNFKTKLMKSKNVKFYQKLKFFHLFKFLNYKTKFYTNIFVRKHTFTNFSFYYYKNFKLFPCPFYFLLIYKIIKRILKK